MHTWEINGKKYTIEYRHYQKYLVHVDAEQKEHLIRVNTSGNLSYLVRSAQVSEAIQEWEINHNTKLCPRN